MENILIIVLTVLFVAIPCQAQNFTFSQPCKIGAISPTSRSSTWRYVPTCNACGEKYYYGDAVEECGRAGWWYCQEHCEEFTWFGKFVEYIEVFFESLFGILNNYITRAEEDIRDNL